MWLIYLQNKIREEIKKDDNINSIYNRLEINNQYPHRPNQNPMLEKLVENEIDKIIIEFELKNND